MGRIIFITGTDTGVGKTVLTVLLTHFLRGNGYSAVALKPVCSGGRGDAQALAAAMRGCLTLDEINPWHFRAALAPVLAARREGKRVTLKQVVKHVKRVAENFECVLVEGAGGLLSPLGEKFDSRDLIEALDARPVVVSSNRLGAIHQIRAVADALSRLKVPSAELVLMRMAPGASGAVADSNMELLTEYFAKRRIHDMPRLERAMVRGRAVGGSKCRRVLEEIARNLHSQ